MVTSTKSEDCPLLSLVVPTRNRAEAAVSAVRSALRMDEERLEIVVQDASDVDVVGQHLSGVEDVRVRYFFDGPSDGMTHNWNRAVPRLRGKYVTFIGDDDGVDLAFMDLVRWLDRHELPAAAFHFSKYFWPNVPSATHQGRVWIQQGHTAELTFRDSRTDTLHAMRGGDLSSRYYRLLPRVYHGVVRRDVFMEIGRRNGTCFASANPDWFVAWSLSPKIRRLAFFDYPFTIDGKCAQSNSGRNMTRESKEALLEEFSSHSFVEQVPRTPITSPLQHKLDSVARALLAAGEERLLEEFSYPKWFAATCAERPDYALQMLRLFADSLQGLDQNERAGRLREFGQGARIFWADRVSGALNGYVRSRGSVNPLGGRRFDPHRALDIEAAVAVQNRRLEEEGVLDRLAATLETAPV